jgi:hypothetical protein
VSISPHPGRQDYGVSAGERARYFDDLEAWVWEMHPCRRERLTIKGTRDDRANPRLYARLRVRVEVVYAWAVRDLDAADNPYRLPGEDLTDYLRRRIIDAPTAAPSAPGAMMTTRTRPRTTTWADLPKDVQRRYRFVKDVPGIADALSAFFKRLDREYGARGAWTRAAVRELKKSEKKSNSQSRRSPR